MKAAGLPWPFHVARAVPVGTPSGAGARSALPACAAALSSAAARAACSAVVFVMVVHPLAVRGQLAPGAPVWGAVLPSTAHRHAGLCPVTERTRTKSSARPIHGRCAGHFHIDLAAGAGRRAPVALAEDQHVLMAAA